jgi:hypothetical protein
MKPLTPTQLFVLLLVMLWGVSAHAQSHTATYSINDASCTTTAPCTAQIYRVALAAGSTCPAAGNSAYIEVQTALAGTAAATTTHWNYTDTGASLVSGATYCGYATTTFISGGGPSLASVIFQGQIPTPLSPPPPPTMSVTLK